ncbi:retrotransposon protein, putative, ty1-copia subclass [Tanacetum coccineum]
MIRWGPGLCVSQPDWSTATLFEQDNSGGYSIALQIEAANVSGGHVKPALTFGQVKRGSANPCVRHKLYCHSRAFYGGPKDSAEGSFIKSRANDVVQSEPAMSFQIILLIYKMTTSVGNNSVFRSFFEKQKLTGPNFIDWYRQLRLVLSTEDKEYYLEHPIPVAPVATSGQQILLRPCSLCGKGYRPKEVALVLIISICTAWGRPWLNELHAMLKLHEDTLPKKYANLHIMQSSRKVKERTDGLSAHTMLLFAPKTKLSPPPKKDNPAKDAICHQCGEVGHWRRNCPVYLTELMKKKKASLRGASASGQEFLDHLKEHGIIAQCTPPYTPQNNSVSERRNQTLLDMVRSMMSQTTLSKSFWDYAIETAARILNMIPTKKVDKTPYEIWHGKAPKLSYLKVWGCEALVKRDTLTKPDKLDPRSFRCIFVGYPKETMGYSFYNPSENKVFVARNAEFFENDLIDLKASGSVEDLELIQEEDTNPSVDTSLNHEEDDQEIDEPQSDINPIRRSTRTRRPTDRLCLYIDTEEHELGDLGEPANYKAALLDPESKKWLDAMNVEMQSMKDNDVWVLVELPPNARTVGSKWLFKKKTDMDGAVYVFKARLVAKGFTQTYEVDYEETFSPVADIRAIRILIAIAAYYDYEIWQMDVKTAFLNVNPKYPNHVCKLKRSIYRLKQASRQWNKRFDDEIKKFGFTQNPDEPCVYLKASGSYVAILILYVDDILLMGNNIPMLQDVKSYLGRSFAMKDLGDAAYILGIKIYRDRSKRLISLCQSAYIEKILKRYYMENSKRGTIPMQEKLKLSKSQEYWTAVKNILKYLRDTKDMFLVYGGNMERQLKVSCYTDAGYLTDADDLKSQTGYVFVLNGGVVNWKSTKQSIFATSSTDSEYIAAFDASKEAVWIRKFIYWLGIVPTIKEPISMYCDNTRAIAIAKDDGVTKGARHFHAKVHYLRETIKLGDVKIEKVDTDDNLADPFTKALAFPNHSELTRNIGMLPASSFL